MASGSETQKRKKGLGLGGAAARAVAAGRLSAVKDLQVEEDNLRLENAARLLPIEQIRPRPSEDTRPVNQEHVAQLVESIRLIGLIQPVYLDRNFHLVAGAHRLAAFTLLAREEPQRWSKIPVVVDPDLDAITDPEQALLKEIAENEKRSNLTPAQVQAAAERLIASDSRFTRKRGRLKSDERALTPFLASVFGVSTRYVRSLLNEPSPSSSSADAEHDDDKRDTRTPEEQQSTARKKLLKKMQRSIKRWEIDPFLSEDNALIDQLKLVERMISERL